MCKKPLLKVQKLTDVSAIETDPVRLRDEAIDWARALWKVVKRRTGHKNNVVLPTAARMAGIEPGTLWSLRYRPPKTVETSLYNKLKLAHERYVTSPEATIAENLEILRSLPPSPKGLLLMASMEEYLRSQEGPETRPPAEPTTTQTEGE